MRPVGIDVNPRRLRFGLVAEPCAAAQARRMTRTWLTAWQVSDETCDSAALVVSELVTNAIVHTSSRQIVCELSDETDRVRITVGDEGCTSDAPPCRSAERDGEEHGRGLLLVAAVCSAWGAQEWGSGLQVWAELPCTADHRTGIEADTVRGTGAEWVS
ncbi:ATP-binding protein [Streptomyces odontomachi]|uniref:ATP-binding protein n=1 Tax=Streptomyces odontomachi TaxID=2944940 RepID=UPI00210B8280|nr:ATP-binding protein [Streptomyces sp. ODS25]